MSFTKILRFFYSIFFLFLSFTLSAQFARGLDFDDASYAAVPKRAKLTRALDSVPAAASVKSFAPIPKSQGQYGTCAAWATAYCGRTIVEAVRNNWLDKKIINNNAYSPAFLFRLLQPFDGTCRGGSVLASAMDRSKTQGNILFTEAAEKCIPAINDAQLAVAATHKVKDYLRVFDAYSSSDNKTRAVKKSLSEKKPVIIGMICPPSFNQVNGVWIPVEEPLDSYGGHAMCVVGYDDTKFGGAFEVQNSWGTEWGNNGYAWIKYTDFARFVRYGFEFADLPPVQPAIPDIAGSIKCMLADGSPMPVTLRTQSRGLSVVPSVSNAPTLPQYISPATYASGTRFRVLVSNDQPAFVYVISSDLTDSVYTLFPFAENISAALTDRKNEFALPDEDHYIEFDNNAGKEWLCVLYSREPLNLTEIKEKLMKEKGGFPTRVSAVLKDRLVAAENTRLAKDQISFSANSKGKSLLALMIELEHK